MDIHNLLGGTDVEVIARRLLGATIITRINGNITSGKIVETEAYKAPLDRGSHAFGGRRTARTETLYDLPGTAYIYLCYGIHHLFNIVTGPRETAHAVLLRAIEPTGGIDVMIGRRQLAHPGKNLTNGPGKLSQALGITTAFDSHNLLSPKSKISVNLESSFLKDQEIIAGPRVGIAYAKECAQWPWRFRIKNNPWTSLPHEVSYMNT